MTYKGCPWCGVKPEVTKHFRDGAWHLIHRCKIMGPITLDWTSSESSLLERWNARPKKAGNK